MLYRINQTIPKTEGERFGIHLPNRYEKWPSVTSLHNFMTATTFNQKYSIRVPKELHFFRTLVFFHWKICNNNWENRSTHVAPSCVYHLSSSVYPHALFMCSFFKKEIKWWMHRTVNYFEDEQIRKQWKKAKDLHVQTIILLKIAPVDHLYLAMEYSHPMILFEMQ